MVLLPIKIWAQKPVMFDFPEPAKDDVISTLIEKNGITLRFSSKSGKESLPQYSHNKEYSYLKLDIDELLTIEGKECVITSIKFIILDNQRCLKVYMRIKILSFHVGKLTTGRHFINNKWMKK